MDNVDLSAGISGAVRELRALAKNAAEMQRKYEAIRHEIDVTVRVFDKDGVSHDVFAHLATPIVNVFHTAGVDYTSGPVFMEIVGYGSSTSYNHDDLLHPLDFHRAASTYVLRVLGPDGEYEETYLDHFHKKPKWFDEDGVLMTTI